MALIVKDRVRETTTTTGTGTLTLIAPVTGFQSFSVIGNGNTTYYSIVDVATGAWEVGIGTYTSSGTTLSRDIVLESSTGGAKISFSSGTKDVFCTYPAERSVSQADVGTDPNEIPLNQYLGSMAYQDRAGVNISGGVATLSTATVTSIQNDTAISNVEPSLMLNFAAVEALDPRITYTRASTATYYNGVTTAVAEQNLLLQSQTFGNASWSKVGSTATDDTTTAPDGTTTADSFIPLATNGVHRAQQTTTGVGVFAFSVFVKANGYSKVGIWDAATTGAYAAFDLSAGTVLSSGAGASSATITALTNSWYRISFVATMTASIGFSVQVLDPAYTTGSINNAWLADGTSGVFLWGAQLEQRSAVSAYTPTTTQAITNYIPVLLTAASGVPRFDHNPISGDSLGFLVEEQRTNLVTYSSDYSNAAWTKTNTTITADTIVAPDGTLTGDKLVDTTATGAHTANQSPTVINNASYTISVYAKAAERNWLYIQEDSGGNNYAFFNLSTGVIGTVNAGTATITSVGNGWYRCTLTHTQTIGTTERIRIGVSNANAALSYTGDGYSGLYLWGAQLEAGAFPTSYVATVASQVTRAADAASMTGTNFSSWYSQGQGTLYFENLSQNTSSANNKNLQLSDGSVFNEIWVGGGSPGTSARCQIEAGGTTYFDSFLSNQVTAGQFGKYAVSFETNNAVLCANGTLGFVDTAVPIPSSINRLLINPPGRAGYYKKIVYFPRRLSNEELQEMTS